jgi:hypothetical protein
MLAISSCGLGHDRFLASHIHFITHQPSHHPALRVRVTEKSLSKPESLPIQAVVSVDAAEQGSYSPQS